MLSSSFLRIDPVFWTNTNVRDNLLKSMVCHFLNFISHPPPLEKSALCVYSFTMYFLYIPKILIAVSLWKLD